LQNKLKSKCKLILDWYMAFSIHNILADIFIDICIQQFSLHVQLGLLKSVFSVHIVQHTQEF